MCIECVCVCMCACVHMSVRVCVCVCVFLIIRIYMYICKTIIHMNTDTHARTHVHSYIRNPDSLPPCLCLYLYLCLGSVSLSRILFIVFPKGQALFALSVFLCRSLPLSPPLAVFLSFSRAPAPSRVRSHSLLLFPLSSSFFPFPLSAFACPL